MREILTLTVLTMISAIPQIAFKGKAGAHSPTAFNSSMVRPVRSKAVDNLVLGVAGGTPGVGGDGGIINEFPVRVHSQMWSH